MWEHRAEAPTASGWQGAQVRLKRRAGRVVSGLRIREGREEGAVRIAGTVNERGAWRNLSFAVSCLVCAAMAAPLPGQAPLTITAVGYEIPAVVVSPGQIVTLFVDGFGPVEEAHADKLPLPTEPAGVQVLVGTLESPRTPAPIFSVKEALFTSDRAAITVQIPYEIAAVTSPQLPTATHLTVVKDGRESPAILAYTVEVAPRVAHSAVNMSALCTDLCARL